MKDMENLWTRCNNCRRIQYKQDILDNLYVCPACSFHFRLTAQERLAMLFDEGRYELYDENMNQAKTSLPDAVLNAAGSMGGIRVLVSAMEFAFMGGSMGSVVGEKVTRALERALAEKLPVIVVSCSGGARAGIPYISLMTDPTTGGTTASYAMLGDINIAEPNALIGFAGPRVIEQTIKEKLPKGFQRSEFLLQHGMLDAVVGRREIRDYLIRALRLFLNRPQ
jgi:acetyl-CoA carboxylase carboxyl transferase subunit beta